MDSDRQEQVQAQLSARRQQIQARIDQVEADVTHSTAGGISFGKRVGDGTSIAVERLTQVAAHGGLHETLDQLNRAEARLAAGEYGSCEICGDDIGAARLQARPTATRCVRCA